MKPHKFLTVFLAPKNFLEKDKNRTIGTVEKGYPVGVYFALAGRACETIDVNVKSKAIFVKRVPGIFVLDLEIEGEVDIHTMMSQKIRSVLKCDDMYPYLIELCRKRLSEIRYIARNSGILINLVTTLSGIKYAIFPWIETRQIFTLHYLLLHKKIKNKRP